MRPSQQWASLSTAPTTKPEIPMPGSPAITLLPYPYVPSKIKIVLQQQCYLDQLDRYFISQVDALKEK